MVCLRVVDSPRLMRQSSRQEFDRTRPAGVRGVVDHSGPSSSSRSPRGRHGPLPAGPAHPRDDHSHVTQGPRHDFDGGRSTRLSVRFNAKLQRSGLRESQQQHTEGLRISRDSCSQLKRRFESPLLSLFPK